MSNNRVLHPDDPRPNRAVGVVRESAAGKVVVLGRTTDTSKAGVHTPAGVLPDLDEDGVFALRYQRVIRAKHFGGSDLPHLGMLPDPYRARMKTILADASLEQKLKSLRSNRSG
jgi:hypothetical protein